MGYLQQRTKIKTLPIEVKRKFASIFGEKYFEQSNGGPTREGRCYCCDRKKCKNCENYICKEHTVTFTRNVAKTHNIHQIIHNKIIIFFIYLFYYYLFHIFI